MQITDLPTPQVLVDRPRLLRNIARQQEAATRHGLRLRPHAKTHKSPAIAAWQIGRGAVGICCAKLGEAEIFADAGVTDIRLPYPVNPANAPRLLALMDRAAVSIIVDHLDVARAWSDVMRRAGRRLDVLIKVDVGFHRCGIDPRRIDARAFVRAIAAMPGLNLRGLLSHAGQGYHAASEAELKQIADDEAALLGEVKAQAAQDGVALDEISVGSTPTFRYTLGQPGLTEIRPGNYVYYDRTQVALGAATPDDCALTVLAMVVSKPAPDRIILDSGSKTLTTDGARGIDTPAGHGAIITDLVPTPASAVVDPSLVIERLSEEHAVVRVTSGTTPLQPGDRVRVIPNHSCVVSNLVDRIHLVDGPAVLDTLPVAARGKIF
ncbi:MAG: alanine racemase [Acidobacteriota bacterium]|nr:alanine racemase [Acidobacteriota bacterium]